MMEFQESGTDRLITYFKALAARVFGRGLPPLDSLDDGPGVRVRDPRRRGPGGRTNAVAVEEPPERTSVDARGASGS
jgi:hypothetical protein